MKEEITPPELAREQSSALRRLKKWRWLDRLLFRVGCSPRYATTAASRSIQKRPDKSKQSLRMKFHEWMWREHSFKGAVSVFFAIALLILDFCLVAALFLPAKETIDEDLSMLGTLAQVAGGAFATVITVVVFAIGLVSQRTDGTAMYTPFVARRHHVFVVAAAAASICLVNTIGLLAEHFIGLNSTRYLLLANFVTIPLVIFITLWLVCGVIEAAGGTDLVSTVPVFRSAMNRLAEHDRLLSVTAQQLDAAISNSPLKLNYFAGYSSTLGRDGRFFGSGEERLVVDVDLHVLGQITECARRFEGKVEFSLLAAPGMVGDKRGVLHVAVDRAAEAENPKAKGGVSIDTQSATTNVTLESVLGAPSLSELRSLTSRLFQYGKQPDSDSDLRQFFARAQADLERLALSADSVTFEARMSDYRSLVGEWLAAAGPTATMQRAILFEYKEPRFVGPLKIDLANILRVSVRSGDFFTYKVAVDSVFGLISDADSHGAVYLYREACGLLDFAFYLAMENKDFRADSQDLFDRRISFPLSQRKSLRNSPTDSIESLQNVKDQRDLAMRYAILGSLLSMIRRAVEAGEVETAKKLIDRMTHNAGMEGRPGTPGQVAPSEDNWKSLVQYALIVIVGWCHHMIEEKHSQAESAIAVIKHAFLTMPPQHVLVGIWELYSRTESPRSSIDDWLRLTHWDLGEDERRAGMVYTRSGGNEWITDGFWIAMLQSRSPHTYELRNFFPMPPSRWLWTNLELDQRLTRLQSALRPEAKTKEQRAAVIELIRQRQRAGEAASLRTIAQTPLSERRKEKLKSQILDGVVKHRKMPLMLSSRLDHMPPSTVVPLPRVLRKEVPRDYLLEINSWGGDYGDGIAEEIVDHEFAILIFVLTTQLVASDIALSFASPQEAIRRAVNVLKSRGFEPDFLILPSDNKFACALFERPLWELARERSADWEYSAVGIWESLTVLRCPCRNTSSVIIGDSRALFGEAGQSIAEPVVEMVDASEATKQELLSKITSEVGEEPLPESSDLRVGIVVSLRPIIGIADLTAATRLEVTSDAALFAMNPWDKLYHRTECSEIDRVEHLVFSRSTQLAGETDHREPCKLCQPDRSAPDITLAPPPSVEGES